MKNILLTLSLGFMVMSFMTGPSFGHMMLQQIDQKNVLMRHPEARLMNDTCSEIDYCPGRSGSMK